MSRLKQIICRGEEILAEKYGLIESFQEYKSLKYDIHQFFENLILRELLPTDELD
jgi:hypothetical protein